MNFFEWYYHPEWKQIYLKNLEEELVTMAFFFNVSPFSFYKLPVYRFRYLVKWRADYEEKKINRQKQELQAQQKNLKKETFRG